MAITLLSACSDDINQYQGKQPTLDLPTYLQGKIEGDGIIQNWRGHVVKSFHFSAEANWQDNICTLDEHMTYDDGSADHRIWHIEKIDDHHYQANTKDVIGKAMISVQGNAMQWRYQMDVKVKDSTYRLKFDDWMYLVNNDTLINKNRFKKFGITVGSLTLFMHKVPE